MRMIGSLMTVACVVLVGCAGTTGRLDRKRRVTALDRADVPADVREAILKGDVKVGMTEEMVATAWGIPNRVTVHDEGSSALEAWGYGTRFTPGWETTLIFEAGTLVDLQKTRIRGVLDWDRNVDVRSADPHSVARNERSPLAP